ncbi:uncharacterized protein LOC129723883 [Wyeomyia smithii]|uniref:uncharacterized protein LOC129723883 n=1 Tax=Wyeomyia smithii TaxID=174621 RepID=UPI00246803F6|nr:uncharacterized protein LOC129723883 [Wyeomyia smithii]
MLRNQNITNVPGDVKRGSGNEKRRYVEDLNTLSKRELLDLKNRQELLLQNRSRILKLPDKGAKAQKFYDEILKQLHIHDDVSQAAELFSELNISAIGKKSLAKMEWSTNNMTSLEFNAILDSDDDLDDQKTNPMALLAQSTTKEKKTVLPPYQPSLITDQDIKEIEQMKQEGATHITADIIEIDSMQTPARVSGFLQKVQETDSNVGQNEIFDIHSIRLCRKENTTDKKERFLPFRTTKTNVHDIDKERNRYLKHAKCWDNTAATPPASTHCPAKMLTLDESIHIQAEKNKLVQAAQNLYAKERLKRRLEINEKLQSVQHDVMFDSIDFHVYRTSSESESEGEHDVEARFNSDGE